MSLMIDIVHDGEDLLLWNLTCAQLVLVVVHNNGNNGDDS